MTGERISMPQVINYPSVLRFKCLLDCLQDHQVIMPISFGSVGDIISVCLIVKDLVAALDDSRGSSTEYREVIRELWGLDRALLEVDLLSRTCDNTVELNALCMTARQA